MVAVRMWWLFVDVHRGSEAVVVWLAGCASWYVCGSCLLDLTALEVAHINVDTI